MTDGDDHDGQGDWEAVERIADALTRAVQAHRSHQPDSLPISPILATSPAAVGDVVTPGARQGGGDYPDHFSLRLRAGDRQRFRDFAWRQRVTNGEAFKRLLDAGELLERWNAPTMSVVDRDE